MEQVCSDLKVIQPKEQTIHPVIIRPADNANYRVLCEIDNKEFIKGQLLSNGAVLIRGFDGLDNVHSFQDAFQALCGDMLQYKLQTSPRTQVDNNVYTSTDHPASQHIYMHTESSYSKVWPRHIGFFCLIPSLVGGETPIMREQLVVDDMSDSSLQKFNERGVRYVRNFTRGLGLTWQKSYQVDTKEEAEQIIKDQGMEFTWVNDNHLRVEWNMPAFHRHPVTKQELWFNHMYFGHKSLYDKKVRSVIPEDFLPFLTFYGDGEPVEEQVVEKFTNIYKESSYVFKWQLGDLLLLENMIYSHGRNPYEGQRKILVGMANEVAY